MKPVCQSSTLKKSMIFFRFELEALQLSTDKTTVSRFDYSGLAFGNGNLRNLEFIWIPPYIFVLQTRFLGFECNFQNFFTLYQILLKFSIRVIIEMSILKTQGPFYIAVFRQIPQIKKIQKMGTRLKIKSTNQPYTLRLMRS
jgi:hypothetical protein